MDGTVTIPATATVTEPQVQTGAPADQAVAGDRPAWLPPEFKTVDDFTKSYSETKAELTRRSQELAELKKTPATPPEQAPEPKKDDAPKSAEGKELAIDETPKSEAPAVDWTPYSKVFAETGDVPEETRQEIAEKHLKSIFGDQAKQIVDDFIEAKKAQAKTTAESLKAVAGGPDSYNEMIGWAKDNLSSEEKARFNAAVNSGDYVAAKFAIEGVAARWKTNAGREPSLIQGDGSYVSGDAFKSQAEITRAMADPRYKTDPTYRTQVMERLGRSSF